MSSPTPDPLTRLLELIAQLPADLTASSRNTNHFELTSSNPTLYWWLDLGDMLHPFYIHNPITYTQTLDRLQLILDLAAAAKAAETQLAAIRTEAEP